MKTAVVDLDGVIAYFDGWKGPYHLGEPNIAGVLLLQKLKEAGVKIVICTCRLNEQWPDECDYDREYELIKQWLDGWDIPYDEIYRGHAKPYGDVYIDDRAVQFPLNASAPEAAEAVYNEAMGMIYDHPDDGKGRPK